MKFGCGISKFCRRDFEVKDPLRQPFVRPFSSSAHVRALQCCDLAKEAFINRLFRPQAILSVVLSPGKEKTPGPKFSNPDHFFQKNWSGDQNFQ